MAVAKRQVEQLARSAAVDVDGFDDALVPEPGASGEVLVVSVDGKGIVIRPDSLRPATEKAAAAATNKLKRHDTPPGPGGRARCLGASVGSARGGLLDTDGNVSVGVTVVRIVGS